jgi:hypothetical protein
MEAGHDEQRNCSTEYEPNWTLPLHDAIREDNWAQYCGAVVVLWESLPDERASRWLASEQLRYGAGNVYTGDAYDYEEDRPLRHKPGKGIYVSEAGLAYSAYRKQAFEAYEARRARRPSAAQVEAFREALRAQATSTPRQDTKGRV